jgi:pimeloyl-ACP methyl ester carboxylesterase
MFARNQQVRISYSRQGDGDPVLLVMGLGMAASAWWRTVPVLAASLQVLTFDNRGAGRSDAPPGPYTIAEMAADAIAVLDAVHVESAHVYGISLGGMIAQELALTYPARVRRLVLGATSAGGSAATLPDEATLGFVERRAEMPFEEAVWASVPYLHGERTRRCHAGRIGHDVARRLRAQIGPEPYYAQLAAARAHDAAGRLAQIAAPTLVVHGGADRMVPATNGRRLAELVPGAELQVWDEAGHLYPTDEPQADQEILRFLLAGSVSRGALRSPQRRSAPGARA